MNLNASFDLPDGTVGAYQRGPAAADAPAVLVLQEIFGVNGNMRRIVDRFAEQGFHAVAPDLFWRQQPGIDLDPEQPESHERAMALMNGYVGDARNLDDLKHIVASLRKQHRKVGVVGYCLGGRMSLICWLHAEVDAAVVYYGVYMTAAMNDATLPATPLLMHLGATDPLNPPEEQQKVAERLGQATSARLHIHEGVGHAFARSGGSTYAAQAAEPAERETIAFLKTHLGH